MDVDKLTTRVLFGAGGIFLLTSVALAVSPGLGAGLPFGNGTIMGIGGLGIVLGLLSARRRLRSDLTETETPNPERPARTPTPGEDVDRMLYEMTTLRQGVVENREQLEGRLEGLAISIIRNREDCTVKEAREILESGRWTDDEDAIAFFEGDLSAADQGGLSQMVSGKKEAFEPKFRAAVGALTEYADIDLDELAAEDDEGEDEDGEGGLLGGGSPVESNWNVEDSSIPSYETDEAFEDVSLQHTNRWLGVTAFGLVALGAGILTFNPGLMLAGTIGVAYTVYARINAVPGVEHLHVERELSETNPGPGEVIEVTVTVRNDGGSMLPDLRMIDVIPDAFVVTDGTPRLHTALQSGAQASFTYSVRVERGQYQWPLLTVARDFSGGLERTSLLTPDVELTCVPSLTVAHDVPVRSQTTQYAGDVSTESGGSGLEFYSVRDYRPGDPMNRVNWKQLARTGELATVDFRQERAATITILFDTRQSAYVSESPGKLHAVDRSVHAASDVFGALYDAGHLVGLAAFDTVPCWFSPGAGSEHRERARLLFAQHPALSPQPPERDNIQGSYIDPMTHVRRRLSSNSQIFLFTPLVDDYAAEVARRLDSGGHLVTVISPDTTASRTIGQQLTRIERTVRVRYLRERGIRVVDWDPDERLDLQLDRAQARWA
ncbi:DUF7269 family protein [Halomontanus rarus]|uniref:DUF7269 family protein n=1 Tax=Halomontanus rarus TaxID=3034020 RepID=UPI001A99995A